MREYFRKPINKRPNRRAKGHDMSEQNEAGQIEVGSSVTYADINLRHYHGTVSAIGRTKNGGDCLVQWSQYPFVSEECMFNLARKS